MPGFFLCAALQKDYEEHVVAEAAESLVVICVFAGRAQNFECWTWTECQNCKALLGNENDIQNYPRPEVA